MQRKNDGFSVMNLTMSARRGHSVFKWPESERKSRRGKHFKLVCKFAQGAYSAVESRGHTRTHTLLMLNAPTKR